MAMSDEKRLSAEVNAIRANRNRPVAAAAHFDRKKGKIVIELENGSEFSFPPRLAQGLENASADQLEKIEISALGTGLHWPALDADLYVPALLEGVFGAKTWAAAQLGKAGGSSQSQQKTAAARENGKKGGRPRKAASHPA